MGEHDGVLVGVTSMLTDLTMSPSELAVAVEERGFESLWLPEHSHIPTSRESPWPGSKPGSDEPLPYHYSRYVDLFVSLSMAAAVTSRIRLGSSVCLVAQHDPIQLAKQVATLDHLSGGRVILGIGYGWNREEAANHGMVEWGARREIVREKVAAMRRLWSDEVASFDGDHVHVAPSWMWPKPVQAGGPPVILGGGWGPKLCEAVAEWADGWMPVTARASLVGRVEVLWDACAVPVGTRPRSRSTPSARPRTRRRWRACAPRASTAPSSPSGTRTATCALRALDRFAAVRDELEGR